MGQKGVSTITIQVAGSMTVIIPSLQECDKKSIHMEISQGAFGSGDHETTQACLQLMQCLDLSGKNFLDIGSGTGILGIAASKLGAAWGVGYDPFFSACQTARINCQQNHVNNFSLLCSYETAIQGKFDIIFANIYFDIVEKIDTFIDHNLKQGGLLLLSGIPIQENFSIRNLFIKKNYLQIRNLLHDEFSTILLQKRNCGD